jgi:hypothetical protein
MNHLWGQNQIVMIKDNKLLNTIKKSLCKFQLLEMKNSMIQKQIVEIKLAINCRLKSQ